MPAHSPKFEQDVNYFLLGHHLILIAKISQLLKLLFKYTSKFIARMEVTIQLRWRNMSGLYIVMFNQVQNVFNFALTVPILDL